MPHSNPKCGHTILHVECKDCSTLLKKWNTKLDAIEDNIEQASGGLKHWASSDFVYKYNATTFQAKEEYYRLATQFTFMHEFDNKLERLVWEAHAEGKSMRDIATALKKKRYKVDKNKVNEVIKRISDEMIIKCR